MADTRDTAAEFYERGTQLIVCARRLEEVTAELSKYQELLGREPGADSAVESSFGDDQSSAPPTTKFSATSIGSEYSSPTSAMNVLTSGVCFRPEEDYSESSRPYYVLGDNQLDRLTAYELFSE